MKRLTCAFAAMSILAALPLEGGAQELEPGRWPVLVVQPNGVRRSLALLVEVTPDPHARWREAGPIRTATLVGRGMGGVLTDVRFENETLSFKVESFNNMTCTELPLQEDGSFAGDCQMPDGRVFEWTITPPAE